MNDIENHVICLTKDNYEIYFCGGGTKNNFLMKKKIKKFKQMIK